MTATVQDAVGTIAPQRVGRRWLLASVAFLALAAAAGVLVGPKSLAPAEVLRVLLVHLPFVHPRGVPAFDASIVWQIRVPRVVLAGLVGGMLALAGAAYQGVFANPLADPYLLGAASGAELGATVAIAYAPAAWAVSAVPMGAFIGAAGAVAAAVLLGRSVRAGRSTTVLILAGVAAGAWATRRPGASG